MPLRTTLSISCNSLSETKTLAGCFASCLNEGLVVGLNGPLGVGKSEFVRFVICAACGDDTEVPSPTFTLVQHYETASGLPIIHMDLYRLEQPEDVLALGIEDSFYEAVNFIEWPDKMGAFWPVNAINISWSFVQNNARTATITADERFCEILNAAIIEAGLHAQYID